MKHVIRMFFLRFLDIRRSSRSSFLAPEDSDPSGFGLSAFMFSVSMLSVSALLLSILAVSV